MLQSVLWYLNLTRINNMYMLHVFRVLSEVNGRRASSLAAAYRHRAIRMHWPHFREAFTLSIFVLSWRLKRKTSNVSKIVINLNFPHHSWAVKHSWHQPQCLVLAAIPDICLDLRLQKNELVIILWKSICCFCWGNKYLTSAVAQETWKSAPVVFVSYSKEIAWCLHWSRAVCRLCIKKTKAWTSELWVWHTVLQKNRCLPCKIYGNAHTALVETMPNF